MFLHRAPPIRVRRLVAGSSFALLLVACGPSDPPPTEPSRVEHPSADVPELEVRASGIDRFTTCPPPGGLGQHWIPPLPSWTPPPESVAASPAVVDEDFIARTAGRTPTELAVEATHRDFRSCYRRSLLHYPIEEGRVAIVLRVGADGRVAKVESYGACELSPEAIGCMYDVARKLRFAAPPSGSDTLILPAAFASRDGMHRTVPTFNDAYTAAAYVTVETARPALHVCEQEARGSGRSVYATGTFTMSVAESGRVTSVHVDPWSGERTLVLCAAHALEGLTFRPPTGGSGTVIARLNFNPRQGVR